MPNVSLTWSALNEGELSPLLEGRTDMPQYMKGGDIMLNMVPTIQGPAQRRGGTRFIGNATNDTVPSLMIRFSRSQTESYILEFSNHSLRFWFNGGLVMNNASAYTIATPYASADLYNADGTPAVVAAESIDELFLAHPDYPPQVLSYFGATNWTIAPLVNTDGPWQDGNPTQTLTVYATGSTAIGSTVTLTASSALFQAGHVGSLFRLHQQDLTTIKPWQPGQQTPVIANGVLRRSGFCTYKAVSVAAGTTPTGGTTLLFVQTGGVTLIHTAGNAWDGDQTTTIDPIGSGTYYSTGVEWAYQDCGYGVIQITSYSNATTVTGTVLRTLPAAVIGSSNASWIWEMGAWNAVNGYPNCVTFFRQRLTFGGSNRLWMSVVGDYANFADMDFGEVLADSAITVEVVSEQNNNILALSAADTMLVCTEGGEFLVGQQSISDPLGPGNIQISPQSSYGCRAIPPIRAQQFALFVQRNGRFLREASFNLTAGPNGAYLSPDITVVSEHITNGGVIAMAWARAPQSVVWMPLGNGNLISLTYAPDQNVRGWTRHDVVGSVVNVAVVPNSTGSLDDVYIQVARVDPTLVTHYTIERIEQPFANEPGDRQQDCFYVDCGLSLYNTINNTLTPGGAGTAGAENVPFFTFDSVGPFTAPSGTSMGDVGRYIHFDYTTTGIGEDGLPYPVPAKAVAQITSVVNTKRVLCTIDAPWPPLLANTLMPANSWRMTVTQITNPLPAWDGRTISILGDGGVQEDQTLSVTPITIPLSVPASVVHMGLKSPSVFRTMKPEGGDPTGSAQGKLKRDVRLTIRYASSLGFSYGDGINELTVTDTRTQADAYDTALPIVSGDTERLSFNGQWDREGRIMIAQDAPLPLTIVGLFAFADVSPDS